MHKAGGQVELTPNALHAGQSLLLVVDEGHESAGPSQGDTVDARDAGHAKKRRFQHRLDGVLAL